MPRHANADRLICKARRQEGKKANEARILTFCTNQNVIKKRLAPLLFQEANNKASRHGKLHCNL